MIKSSSIDFNIHPERKYLAILIDPQGLKIKDIHAIIEALRNSEPDVIFLGGSLLSLNISSLFIEEAKKVLTIPIFLFPGHSLHVVPSADGILLLSLVSGRNPEFLIGHHVHIAPLLKASGMKIIPTAYLLIEGGHTTTAHYMSQTMPIPSDKPLIAACTALAATQLGMKWVYMDAGSGASKPVSLDMIQAVRREVEAVIVVGGGIRTPQRLKETYNAGAQIVVIGTQFEKDPTILKDLCQVRDLCNNHPAC